MQTKRLLLSFAITILFFVLWTWMGEKLGYNQRPEPQQIEQMVEGEPQGEKGEAVATSTPEANPSEEESVEEEPVEVIEKRRDKLENEDMIITLDNEGGVIRNIVLKKFWQTSKELDNVSLVFADKHWPGQLIFDDNSNDSKWMYNAVLNNNQLVYTARSGNTNVVKTYTLGSGHDLDCQVEYSGTTANGFLMVVSEGLQPIGPNEKIKPSLLSMGAINPKMMFATWSEEGDHEQNGGGKNKDRFKPALEEEKSIEWAGIKDNYFASVFIPDKPVNNLYTRIVDVYPGRKPITLPAVAVRGEGTFSGTFYMGPINEEYLLKTDERLENLITYGWAGLLSKWLLAGLELAHTLTGNWGWAIVILTLFIRLLMIPLTIPSVKSSFKMRGIQPKIEKLKQKYSGNDMETKQKLSQATFELYRKEGVNPFSSCFTALAQMPVFFAYFSLLRTSMSLRQAEWVIWVNDLSVSDPTFILPILMGVTMFFSTMAMPMPSADPMQAKMMKIMPVMFSFMFIFMPSGLILYMITSNIFTLGQTKLLHWRYANQ